MNKPLEQKEGADKDVLMLGNLKDQADMRMVLRELTTYDGVAVGKLFDKPYAFKLTEGTPKTGPLIKVAQLPDMSVPAHPERLHWKMLQTISGVVGEFERLERKETYDARYSEATRKAIIAIRSAEETEPTPQEFLYMPSVRVVDAISSMLIIESIVIDGLENENGIYIEIGGVEKSPNLRAETVLNVMLPHYGGSGEVRRGKTQASTHFETLGGESKMFFGDLIKKCETRRGFVNRLAIAKGVKDFIKSIQDHVDVYTAISVNRGSVNQRGNCRLQVRIEMNY